MSSPSPRPLEKLKDASSRVLDEYAPHEHVPLSGYVGALVCFSVGFAGLLMRVRQRRRTRVGLLDTLLLGVATHKLSRIIAKDYVTAPIRAPFTERAEAEGGGEVHDKPRGGLLRRTLGNLSSCPYCLGPWVATGLNAALLTRPEETRFTLRVLTATAFSDFLHQRYSRLNESRKLVQAQRKQAEGMLPAADT